MFSDLNPIEHYFSNDYYVSQISLTDREIRIKGFSPKVLIQGYWKKDYSQIVTNQPPFIHKSNTLLPLLKTKEKPRKKSFSKLSEKLLNISNCFEPLPLRQQKTEVRLQQPVSIRQSPSLKKIIAKVHSHERKPIPGHLFKGALLKPTVNQSHESTLCDREFKIGKDLIKSSKLRTKTDLRNSDTPPSPPTLLDIDRVCETDRSHRRASDRFRELRDRLVKKNRKPSPLEQKRQFSPAQQLQVVARRSTLNNQMQKEILVFQELDLKCLRLECKFHRPSHNAISNVLIIMVEGVLGYDESCYFGFNQDFLSSVVYEEYQIIRNHYFQPLQHNKDYYMIKNLKELFNSISRIYQIALVSRERCDQLVHFVQEKKIKVNAVFKLNYLFQPRTVDITNVLQQLKVNKPHRIVFIQPFSAESLGGQAGKTLEYVDQTFFIPYAKGVSFGNYRLLFLSQISMQMILKQDTQQYKGIIHTNYFIEQFALALQSESNFNEFVQRGQQKIRKINFSSYFRQFKQKVLQQQHFISQLNQSETSETKWITKKKLIQKLMERVENSYRYEQQIHDLVMRNKFIIKNLRKYRQTEANNLGEVLSDLDSDLLILNYCEQFIDSFYYLSY